MYVLMLLVTTFINNTISIISKNFNFFDSLIYLRMWLMAQMIRAPW